VTYRNEEVIKLTSDLVNVKINADKDSLMKKEYGIAGFPTVVLTDSEGEEIDRIYGYADGPQFVEIITDYLAGRNTLDDYLNRAEKEPGMDMYARIAEKYTGRSKYEEAEKWYRRILQEDPNNNAGYSDSALLWMGQMKSRAKQYAGAEEILAKLPRTYPESDLADRAVYERAKVKRYAEKYDDAIGAFRDFMKTYPESELVEDAEIYIAFCYDKKGDKETALVHYRAFQEKYPESSNADWVKKQIDKIENPPVEENSEE